MGVATAIMVGLGIAGTAINARAQLKAGGEAKKVAGLNAKIAQTLALDALERGREDEFRFRQQVQGLIGSQRVGFATQNVDVGVGSAVDVQADTAFLAELDALQIRTNARREAMGFKIQGQNQQAIGQAAQSRARSAAASTIIGGGADTFSLVAQQRGWLNF